MKWDEWPAGRGNGVLIWEMYALMMSLHGIFIIDNIVYRTLCTTFLQLQTNHILYIIVWWPGKILWQTAKNQAANQQF